MNNSIQSTLFRFTVVTFLLLSVLYPYCSSAQVANTKENRDYKYAAGLYAEGMYDLAAREFERFIQNYPSSGNIVYARFFIAGSYFYLKDFSKTIEITGRIRKESPSAIIIDKVLFL